MAVFAGSSERERSVFLAQLANCAQLLNFLAQGNQLSNVWPGASQKGALKCRDNYDFSIVSSLFRKLNDVGEELPLVDANNVVAHPIIAEISESLQGNCACLLASVGSYHEILAVAVVSSKLNF